MLRWIRRGRKRRRFSAQSSKRAKYLQCKVSGLANNCVLPSNAILRYLFFPVFAFESRRSNGKKENVHPIEMEQ